VHVKAKKGLKHLGKSVKADDAPLRVNSEEGGNETCDEAPNVFTRRWLALGLAS